MKLSRFFLTALFLSYFKLTAQDLVVTKKGDSLRCKIESEDAHFMHITIGNGPTQRKILMSYDLVRYSEVNFYSKLEKTPSEDEYYAPRSNNSASKFRLMINGGLGYLTAKLSPSISPSLYDYYNDLRKGFTFNSALDYFFIPTIGAGISYSLFRSKNTLYPVSVLNTVSGQVLIGKLQDDITVNYIGPRFVLRYTSKNKNAVFSPYFSLGYARFQNKAILINSFTITSSTLGRKLGFDLEYRLDNTVFIGFDASYTSLILSKIDVESNGKKTTINLKKDEYDNESRADILVGLRYTF